MLIQSSRTILRQKFPWSNSIKWIVVRNISTSPVLPPETPSPPTPSQTLSTIEPLQEPKFEVVGNVCSLLNVTIPASWPLYTRRGTLVSVRGQIENVTSTLSLLLQNPLSAAVRISFGIPYIYQKVTSNTQISATIATKTHLDSFAVIRLDGRVDWLVTQKNALVAWTGPMMSPKPKIIGNHSPSWGCTKLTGRGVAALSGRGFIDEISLDENDEYIVHPSHLLAYTISTTSPQPHRLSALPFRITIPSLLPSRIYQSEFLREMRTTETVKLFARIWQRIITWSRRTFIGDRFTGPGIILIQSRARRLADTFTARDVAEVGELDPSAKEAIIEKIQRPAAVPQIPLAPSRPNVLKVAVVKDGKVMFQDTETFQEFR